jgi:DNA-binding YbaB/EbfC family protein
MQKNIGKMLKQAQKMQAQMMQAQEDLKSKQVEGSAGGGMVKVTLNGAQEVVGVSINPEVIDPDDAEMLEDLVMAAFKNAQEKVAEMSNQTFGAITGGLNIPGM